MQSENLSGTFEKVRKLKTYGVVMGMAWNADGSRIATLEGMNQLIEVWDTATGNLVATIKKSPAASTRILFTPDGKHLITPLLIADGFINTALNVIDIKTGQSLHGIEGPYSPPHYFGFANDPKDYLLSPDGKRLYVTFNMQPIVIHVYDTATWTHIGVIPDPGALIMTVGPASDELTTVGANNDLRTWNVPTATIVRRFDLAQPDAAKPRSFNLATSCSAIALAPAACLLAFGTRSGGKTLNLKTEQMESGFDTTPVRLLSLDGGRPLSAWPASTQQIRALAFSPDGRVLAAALDHDHSVVLLPSDDLSAAKTLVQFRNRVATMAFSQDGKYLAAAGDEEVDIYRTQ